MFLQPGESKEVEITVPRDILGYFNIEAEYITDVSEFDVWMAHDSDCNIGCHGKVKF